MGVWMLEIDHGRAVGRWTSSGGGGSDEYAVPLLGGQPGVAVRYARGLELETVELPEGTDPSIALELTAAGPELELEDLDRLENATAILWRLLDDGGVLPILRGVVTDIERGSVDEPVSMSLVAADPFVAAVFPDPAAKVSADTWPVSGGTFVLHEDAAGEAYPIPIGVPGDTPAAFAEIDPLAAGTLVVAGCRVAATTLTIRSQSARDGGGAYEDTATIVHGRDLLGRPVARAAIPSSMALGIIDVGWGFRAVWEGTAGGLFSPRTGRAARGLAEVLEAVADLTGLQVDIGRLRAEAPHLDRFQVDTYWNAPTAAWDLVQDLVEIVPGIRWCRSERGLWWQAPRWVTQSYRAELELVGGRDCRRISPLRSRLADSGIANTITVRYAARSDAEAGQQVTLDGSFDARCQRSIERYGVRAYDVEIQTWDRATAELHAAGVAALAAEPRRGLAVVVPATARTERLARGGLVALTLPDVGLHAVAAEVEGVQLGGSEVRLDLTV